MRKEIPFCREMAGTNVIWISGPPPLVGHPPQVEAPPERKRTMPDDDDLMTVLRDELDGRVPTAQIDRLHTRLLARRLSPTVDASGDPGHVVQLPPNVTAPGSSQSGYKLIWAGGIFLAGAYSLWLISSTILIAMDKTPISLDIERILASVVPILAALGYQGLEVYKKKKTVDATVRMAEATGNGR